MKPGSEQPSFQLHADGTAKILVPNQFFADFIEEHFASLIKEVLTDECIQFSTHIFYTYTKRLENSSTTFRRDCRSTDQRRYLTRLKQKNNFIQITPSINSLSVTTIEWLMPHH